MNRGKKITLVPRLRFSEFMSNAAIDFINGDKIFSLINNKNSCSNLPVLAITQELGAIPRDQIDYNVSVSDKSLESYKVVEIGDFIISLRTFQGGIEYSLYHGICSPAYIILRKKINVAEQYYKYYFKTSKFIQDLNKDLEGIRDGKMVSYSQFSAILLPVPEIKEQQKIADCLSSLDEFIAAENKKLGALKAHKKGLMQKLFPTEGKTAPEVRFPGFTDAWEQRKLGEVSDVRDGTHDSPKYYDSGYPLVTSKNLSDFGLDLNDVSLISEDDFEAINKRSKVDIGDILFGMIGTIGNPVIVDKSGFAIKNVALIKEGTDVPNCFLIHLLKSHVFDNYIGLENAGGTQKFLGLSKIRDFVFLAPSVSEQSKIGAFFAALDRLITLQQQKLEFLKVHKDGLMQGLFPSVQEVIE